LTTGNRLGEPTPTSPAGLDRVGVDPPSIPQLTGARSLTAGGSNTFCVTRDEGEIRCWGANQRNRLGLDFTRASNFDASLVGRPVPLPRFGPQLSEFARCTDGLDNDGDGQVDCADSDCAVDLGSEEGVNVLLETWVDWGEYERVQSPAPGTLGHKTVRFRWTAPRSGEFSFPVNNSGQTIGFSTGRVDLRRTSCTASVEAGGTSPTLPVAAGETIYGVMEVSPSNTRPLIQMGIIEE
ncbi:MAG: hypothetical protein AAFQ82_07430, partial [Myxococcota bacterium]